jgi:hypothetical protein
LMESSLAITHLFVPLFQACNSGNLLKLFRETNQRSEVFARAGGGGSTGFCQPKDIYFLPFVTTTSCEKILQHAGVPIENWDVVERIRREVLSVSAELGVGAELERLLAAHAPARFALPPLNSMRAFTRIGAGDALSDPRRALDTLLAGYHAEAITALEGRVRFAAVNLIHLIKGALEARRVAFSDSVIVLPVEYKPVSDARLSMGLRLLELFTGVAGDHLHVPMGNVGRVLARFVVRGFDANDAEMVALIADRLG